MHVLFCNLSDVKDATKFDSLIMLLFSLLGSYKNTLNNLTAYNPFNLPPPFPKGGYFFKIFLYSLLLPW